jgi:predicted ATPase/class 3 adenylate cyclase
MDFITVFTRPEHPLVIFLDDLQWADVASLKLMELLMTVPNIHYLFLIGAYRDNEIEAGHPLCLTLEAMEETDVAIHDLALAPLDLQAVTRLVAETLHCSTDRAHSLAELLIEKTGGNPFFLNEFFKSLYVEELVTFDHEQRRWHWELACIQAQEMTDNVVELMANRVQQLSKPAQAILKLASCIGNQFDLETLALVANAKPAETANTLSEGLTEGLILPLGDTYKVVGLEMEGLAHEITAEYRFAHDRIQQAVYSLIPEEQRQETHWRIGQLLVQNVPLTEQEDRIFDIVNQLNQGLEFLRRDDAARCLYEQWDELARLNLLAGKKAKAAAAYAPAFNYLQVGLELLEADNWQWQYDLTLSLYVEAAEAAYLSGDLQAMERLAEEVLHKARGVLDKVKVYEVKIRAYIARNRHMDAVKLALHVLNMLDITFPDTPTQSDVMRELQRTLQSLRGHEIEDLVNLLEMKDAARLAAMRILTIVINAAYVATPELMSLITFTMVNISVEYGYTSVSAHAYASYGLILCGNIGDIESGYRYGQLALRLLERFDARDLKPRTLMVVNNFIRHWKEHVRETLSPLLEAYQSGLETGDLEFAAIAIYVYCSLSFFTGKTLQRLEQEMASYSDVLARIKQKRAWYMNALYRQVVHNLMGLSPDPSYLNGACYNEEEMLRLHRDANDRTAMYYIYFNKCILCYLFHEYSEAVEYADLAGELSRSAVGSLSIALLHFYDSLARLALFAEANETEHVAILEKVADNQQKMKYWAQHAPMNHMHKFYLVEAERCRVLDLGGDAREYYDQALALARENAYLNEEALCAERAALFYLARDLPKLAQPYLRDSHYAYLTWEAHAKVNQLEEAYPRLLIQTEAARIEVTRTTRSATRTTTRTTSTSRSSTSVLDLPSVIKASQAISGEIVLDSLLSKLMQVLIENAGAERGVLILEKAGEWLIDAEGRIGEEEVTVSQSIPVTADEACLPTTIVNYVARTRQVIVISDASQDNQFPQDAYITTHQPRSILCMPLINQGKLIGMLYMENNLTTDAFTADRLELLSLLSSQVAISIENARLYTNLELALDQQVKLTNAYSRFVPREILQFLGKESIIEVTLGDQIQQEMTVLFSDIRDFTALSEQMSPQENFDFINSYLSRVSPIIREHNGFIDKYIGDAIMALFEGDTDDAVRAAIEMQEEVVSYNDHRARAGYQPISIGVGLHTGNVMLGTVGEQERMEGTVISDTVNLASRLEGLTKLYGSPIIVSEKTLFNLRHPHQYTFFFLDQVKVKGKKDPVSIFEILDGIPEEVRELKLKTRTHFDQGLFHYHAREFDQALKHFKKVLDIDPTDQLAQLYLKRASNFVEYGVPVGWEGIEALSEK